MLVVPFYIMAPKMNILDLLKFQYQLESRTAEGKFAWMKKSFLEVPRY